MMTVKNLRAALMLCGAAVALSGCFGADKVASPGEGVLVGGGTTPAPTPPTGPAPGTPAADCPTGFSNVGVIANLRNCQLPNRVVGNLVLKKLPGVIYSVSGRVAVGDDQGADQFAPVAGAQQGILTVEAGVKLFGSAGADYIVINRGSRIFAEGTATDPVIFTSRQSVLGETGVDSIGQWGGLVLAGRAPTNICPAGVTPPNVACNQGQVEGTNALYGGNFVGDSSGTLRYFRLMHSGFEVLPGNELNGITFAGVGTGTVVENVQVHNSSDDGIEMFGGNVNLKNIVITGADDDSYDTDTGFRGSLQFLIITQRDNGGDRMFEMSCAGNASYCSRPKVANATLISQSSKSGQALELNSGTGLDLVNSVVVTRAPSAADCIRMVGATTTATFNSVFLACGTKAFSTGGIGAAATKAFFDAGKNNKSDGVSTLSGVVNGANETAIVASDAKAISDFFTNTTYVGAVKDANDNWYKGWTCGIEAGSKC